MTNNAITVIMPTAGYQERRETLLRAIESARSQQGVDVQLLMVFNGPNVDPATREQVGQLDGVICHDLELGNLPNAILHGRRSVQTPFFCFLDDDDVYLPGALQCRLQPMLDDASVDMVATNGYKDNNGNRRLAVEGFALDAEQPLEKMMMRHNWLASCGGLYRTATIGEQYFAHDQKYYEWTFTAFLIALEKHIVLVDEPTYVINYTASSLSNSADSLKQQPVFLARMASYPLIDKHKQELHNRIGKAHMELYRFHLQRGERSEAWRHFKQAVRAPGGWRYVTELRSLLLK